MVRIHSLRKDLIGMNEKISPKGRKNLPERLINFGRHLVYSEGTKTEPYYVENIKKCIAEKYKIGINDIEIINANQNGSLNTIGLVRYAIKDVANRLKNDETINHVWIFYDKDSFPKANYTNAHNKIQSLNCKKNEEHIPCDKNNIIWHSMPSNECFELFLMSYFNYQTSALKRTSYAGMIEKEVRKKFPSFTYAKNLTDIHSTLIKAGGTIKKAIRFCKKMEKENNIDNPSSKAYLFLEYFNRYLDD